MYQIKGQLQGVSDILFNRMTEFEIEVMQKGGIYIDGRKISDKVTIEKLYHDDAKNKVHLNDAGNIIIPAWMFKQAMAQGAKDAQLKQSGTSNRKGIANFLIAEVFVNGSICIKSAANINPLPEGYDYLHTVMGKRPPKTGKASIIYRPAFYTGWTADFCLNVLDNTRNPNEIRESLEKAGVTSGIGSWRPEFGRFIVSHWEIIKNGKEG